MIKLIDRKDFIIIALIGLFLTVTLYPKITTSQSPNNIASADGYDSWVDYSEDGRIDGQDFYYLLKAWGTSGDPTKNVTVTNFPLDEEGNIKVNSTCCSSYQNSNVTYKDAVEMTLLEWTSVQWDIASHGVELYYDEISCTLPFCFDPKGKEFNVTGFWIVFIEATDMEQIYQYFDINVNNVLSITTDNLWHRYKCCPHARTINITSEEAKQSIQAGLNTLEIYNASGHIWLFRVTVFIEYEYQA